MKRKACCVMVFLLAVLLGVGGLSYPVRARSAFEAENISGKQSAVCIAIPGEEEITMIADLLPECSREEIVTAICAFLEKQQTRYTSYEERVAGYQLENPENYSTTALLRAVFDYPYLYYVTLHAYDDPVPAMRRLSQDFNGLGELLTRRDLQQAVMVYVDHREWENDFGETDFLKALGLYIRAGLQYTDTVVYTMYGTPVAAKRCISDFGWDRVNYYNRLIEENYPNALRMRNATGMYNCHSYAWYNMSTTNDIWIPRPLAFKTDGYTTNFPWEYGDLLVYSDGENDVHSAVVFMLGNGTVNSTTVISKWAQAGLYIHIVNDCPFYESGYTVTAYQRCVRLAESRICEEVEATAPFRAGR